MLRPCDCGILPYLGNIVGWFSLILQPVLSHYVLHTFPSSYKRELFYYVHKSKKTFPWGLKCEINNDICLMSGSSHIRSVLIGIEYQNCHQTLDVYSLFAILLGQIISKLNYRLVTNKLASS